MCGLGTCSHGSSVTQLHWFEIFLYRFAQLACSPPPLPSPSLFSSCQCDGCLEAWCGGSWLGHGDCQPQECYSTQGLASQLPVEALGHPRHQPPFHDVVVNLTLINKFDTKFHVIKLNQIKYWSLKKSKKWSTGRETFWSRVENQQTQLMYTK